MLEGLFANEDHDRRIQELVFTMAEWHANAKLRLHTDSTVSTLKELTRSLGTRIRYFALKICSLYDTRELPREEAARARRRAKQAAQRGDTNPPQSRKTGPLCKVFNLITYKLHALGDYVAHILRFGTTDSYSTQTVCRFVISTIRESHPLTRRANWNTAA